MALLSGPRSRNSLTVFLVSVLAAVGLWAAAPPAAAAQITGRRSAVRASATLPILLPLAADPAGLAALASAVSTPGSPQYGHYVPIGVLARRFGASGRDRRRAVSFLRRAGAWNVRVAATGLYVTATLRAQTAERLFSTALSEVHGPRGSSYTTPSSSVHIPRGLRGIVTGVVGLDTQPVVAQPTLARARSSVRPDEVSGSGYSGPDGTPAGCAAGLDVHGFAPNQYATAYGFSGLTASGFQGQGERVALIEIDGFNLGDIRAFARCFSLHFPAIRLYGVGVRKALAPSGEATLDLEVVGAVAQRLKSIDVYEMPDSASSLLEGLTAPLGNPGNVPQVISASLGLCERQVKQAVGSSGLQTAEETLEEASATGVSVLAASGDDGSSDCLDSSGHVIAQADVNYPASSPWVTAVGGTNVALSSSNTILDQVVWHDGSAFGDGAGGGGTSAFFDRPSYQTGTVAGARRAVPDVALLADVQPGYDIYCTAPYDRSNPDGCIDSQYPDPWQPVGGTSAATPLMAAGLALVDQDLKQHGQVAVGFANPLLYDIGRSARASTVFQDVISGNNDIADVGCCSAGPGFDEATGWGGVDMSGLAGAALALEPKIPGVSLALSGAQHPLVAKRIVATAGCNAACDVGVYAVISVKRRRTFIIASRVYVLRGAGTRRIRVPFSRAEIRKLKADVRHHDRVTAAVRAAVVDGGGNIERQTAAHTLVLHG